MTSLEHEQSHGARAITVQPGGNQFEPVRPYGLIWAVRLADQEPGIAISLVFSPGQVSELSPPMKWMLPPRMLSNTQVAVKVDSVVTKIRRYVVHQMH